MLLQGTLPARDSLCYYRMSEDTQGVWTGRLRKPRRRRRAETPPTLRSVSPCTPPDDADSDEVSSPPSLSQRLVETLRGGSAHSGASGCPTPGAATAPPAEEPTGRVKEPRSAEWQAHAGYDSGRVDDSDHSTPMQSAVDPADVPVYSDDEEVDFWIQCRDCKKWHLADKEL